jgi:metal-responsive CopG/Arc/MetJ family transcriptional regulator
MKTAISLPDELYAEAEKAAASMGIPRSQLFAKALEEFIDRHKREGITERLNEVYSGARDSDDTAVSMASLESLRELTRLDSW